MGEFLVNSSNVTSFNFDGNGDYLNKCAPFANSPNGSSNYTVITKLKIPSNNSKHIAMEGHLHFSIVSLFFIREQMEKPVLGLSQWSWF